MSVSLAAIAAIGSMAASGLGAGLSAAANADAQSRLKAERDADRRYYDRLLSRDYVNSSENQSLLRKLRDMQKESYNRARATNVVAGGTEAHLASMQAQGNKIISDTGNAIASRADAYKDSVRAAKRGAEKAYSQQMFGLDMQRSQNIANAASQASSAFAGIAGAAGGASNPFGETTQAEAAPAVEAVEPSAPQSAPAANPVAVSNTGQPLTAEQAVEQTASLLRAYQAAGIDPSIFGLGASAMMRNK